MVSHEMINSMTLGRSGRTPRWFLTCALAAALLAMTLSTALADDDESLKDGAKRTGHAVGSAAREIGQGAKKVGKTIGQEAKKVGKTVGEAAKEGGKEFRRAVKEED